VIKAGVGAGVGGAWDEEAHGREVGSSAYLAVFQKWMAVGVMSVSVLES
jgi:hypothetical protein